MATRRPAAEESMAALEAVAPVDPCEPVSADVGALLKERMRDMDEHPERLVPHEKVRAQMIARVEALARRRR